MEFGQHRSFRGFSIGYLAAPKKAVGLRPCATNWGSFTEVSGRHNPHRNSHRLRLRIRRMILPMLRPRSHSPH